MTDKAHGPEGIDSLGHRKYVGGKWELLGRLPLAFLVGAGLSPTDYVVDIGAGALRVGVRLIDYLDPGRYMAVEQHRELLGRGVERELGEDAYVNKDPQLIVSSTFEFDRLRASPQVAFAQSLFTHLPSEHVALCLRRLRHVIDESGVFYATVWFAEDPDNPDEPHDHKPFAYAEDHLRRIAEDTAWQFTRIGEWGHPRGQRMVAFRPV